MLGSTTDTGKLGPKLYTVCARFFFRHIQYISYINYLPLPVRSAYFIVRREAQGHSRLKI